MGPPHLATYSRSRPQPPPVCNPDFQSINSQGPPEPPTEWTCQALCLQGPVPSRRLPSRTTLRTQAEVFQAPSSLPGHLFLWARWRGGHSRSPSSSSPSPLPHLAQHLWGSCICDLSKPPPSKIGPTARKRPACVSGLSKDSSWSWTLLVYPTEGPWAPNPSKPGSQHRCQVTGQTHLSLLKETW